MAITTVVLAPVYSCQTTKTPHYTVLDYEVRSGISDWLLPLIMTSSDQAADHIIPHVEHGLLLVGHGGLVTGTSLVLLLLDRALEYQDLSVQDSVRSCPSVVGVTQ